MRIDTEKITNIIFFLLISIYVSLLQVLRVDNIFYFLFILVFSVMLLRSKKGWYLHKNFFVFSSIACLAWMFISVGYTYSVDSGIKFSFLFALFTFMAIFMSEKEDWSYVFEKCLICGLCIHVFFTIFSLIFTKEAMMISSKLLTAEDQALTELWVNDAGHYAGIAGQTMMNAWFFSILLGFIICKLIVRKSYYKMGASALVLGFLLFVTGKKGSLLANFCAFVSVLLIYLLAKKKHLRKFYSFGFLILCISFLIYTHISLDQFKDLMGTSVASRKVIYGNVEKLFIDSPIIGKGIDSLAFYVGHSAHNIFLQLLCELGIIGFVIFVIAIIGNFAISIKSCFLLIRENKAEIWEKEIVMFSVFYQTFFLICGLFENTLFNYRMYLVYIFSIAALYSVNTTIEKRKRKDGTQYAV